MLEQPTALPDLRHTPLAVDLELPLLQQLFPRQRLRVLVHPEPEPLLEPDPAQQPRRVLEEAQGVEDDETMSILPCSPLLSASGSEVLNPLADTTASVLAATAIGPAGSVIDGNRLMFASAR